MQYFLTLIFSFIALFHSNIHASLPSYAPLNCKQYTYSQVTQNSSHPVYSYRYLSDQPIVFHGDRTTKKIALTFDADMTEGMKYQLQHRIVKSWYNKSIIDILNRTHTKATLFLTGMWIELYPHVTKELAQNPLFELANHSYSHPGFTSRCYKLPTVLEKNKENEILKTQDLLKKYGVDNHLFRFPGGCYAQEDLDLLAKNNLTAIQWDTVGGDAFSFNTAAIYDNLTRNIENGSIIVLHLHGGPNVGDSSKVLEQAIVSLKKKGFEFVKISELLNSQQSLALSKNSTVRD